MRSVCCSRSQTPVVVPKRSFVKIVVNVYLLDCFCISVVVQSASHLYAFLGVKVVAECFAKSSTDEMLEVAKMLLESLYDGNSKYQSQIYKGLIALLTCNEPKVQQRVLHTLQTVQVNTHSLIYIHITCIRFNLYIVQKHSSSSVVLLYQSRMKTAHHSIVDTVLKTLGSIYLEVQDEGKHTIQ